MSVVVAAALALGAVLAVVTAVLRGEERWSRAGALTVFIAMVLVPLGLTSGAAVKVVRQSSTTAFCLSCHEMEPYGRSLLVDDEEFVPAMHFQHRRVSREAACYGCHADYGVFGDLQAKVTGVRHVWAHYVSGVPEKLRLYAPYPNANCLGCHRDARGYIEDKAHRTGDVTIEGMEAGKVSCLAKGCHDVAHNLDEVDDAEAWRAPSAVFP